MKLLRRCTAMIIFLTTLAVIQIPLGHTFDDAIIAVVNDELITLKDLRDYAHSTYVGLVAEGISEAKIEAVMSDLEVNGINKLIEDKLILSQANKMELEVREELVDERIKEIEEKYGTEEQLIEALIKSGATLTDMRNKIRDQMKIKFIIDHEVRSRLYINPQEVTDYYEQNQEEFSQPERINLESIFLSYKDDKVEAFTMANKALKKIEQGESFNDVAKEYSATPSVGIIERGQLLPKIEDAVFDLDINEISPLVEVDNGIYIFKLTGRSPAKIANLEDVSEKIYDLLYKQKFKTRFLSWLETLKEDAYIEIKP